MGYWAVKLERTEEGKRNVRVRQSVCVQMSLKQKTKSSLVDCQCCLCTPKCRFNMWSMSVIVCWCLWLVDAWYPLFPTDALCLNCSHLPFLLVWGAFCFQSGLQQVKHIIISLLDCLRIGEQFIKRVMTLTLCTQYLLGHPHGCMPLTFDH